MLGLALAASTAAGCACGARSHLVDADHDAPALDARDDALAPDAGPDPLDRACWARRCDLEGSRVTGVVRVGSAVVPVAHAIVHLSYAFASHLYVELTSTDACPPTSVVASLWLVAMPADVRLGPNEVVVFDDTGEVGRGTMDVSAWVPPPRDAAGGRLVARLVVALPSLGIDLAIDVTPCADESGP